MSKTDDNQIHERLKILSQIEPSSEATDHAVQRTRSVLLNKDNTRQYAWPTIWRNIFKNPIIKLVTATILMIGFGYIGARLSATQPLDIEELRTTIRNDLAKEMNERWQSAFTANCAQLKDELQQQVRRDLMEFAAQTLAASGTMTNQRLIELAQLIEAARIRDRERIEKAFQQIELNQTRLGKSLLTIASRTNKQTDTQEF